MNDECLGLITELSLVNVILIFLLVALYTVVVCTGFSLTQNIAYLLQKNNLGCKK